MHAVEPEYGGPLEPPTPSGVVREWLPAFMLLRPGSRHAVHWQRIHWRFDAGIRHRLRLSGRPQIAWWLVGGDRTTLAVGSELYPELGAAARRVGEIAALARAGELKIWRPVGSEQGYTWHVTRDAELLFAGTRVFPTAHDGNQAALLAVNALAELRGFSARLEAPARSGAEDELTTPGDFAHPILELGSRRPIRELSSRTLEHEPTAPGAGLATGQEIR